MVQPVAWGRGVLLAIALASLWPGSSQAIPAFARKYGVSCSACHEAWPKLNDQGIAFRDNGYQFGTGRDSPGQLDPAYWPISLRASAGYQYTSATAQPTNSGPQTISQGRIGFNGIDLLMAGTLTRDVSFLVVIEPFLANAGIAPVFPNQEALIASPGETGAVESLWVRADNLFGTPWLNLKLGLGALDLPFDEHRSLTFVTPYSVYHFHAGGDASFLPFELGENQLQLSLEGHDEGSHTRYALSLVQGQNDPGSALPWSAPAVYSHVQHSFFPAAVGVPEVRAGLFGMVGAYPTQALYQGTPGGPPSGPLFNPDGTPAPIVPGTGFDHRPFYREGADLSVYLGELALPFNIEVAYVQGQDSPAFINGATQEAMFLGGLVQATWTPRLDLALVARLDAIRNLQQADPTQAPGFLDSTQGTLAARYTLEVFPRTEVTCHAELSYSSIAGAGDQGLDLNGLLVFGGVDFVF